ncbi:MAG: hypothetical protein MZW92_03485 [Comamonadaceae bacterium]|nr:hypothetical protein [Comamonadaceae bacterium]
MAAARTTEFRVLSTTAILGYGFPEASFQRGPASASPTSSASTPARPTPAPTTSGRASPSPTARRSSATCASCSRPASGAASPSSSARPAAAGPGRTSTGARRSSARSRREEKLTFKMGVIYADVPKARVRRHLAQGRDRAPDLRPAADRGGPRRVGQHRRPDGRRAHPEGPGRGLPGRPGRPLLRPGRLRRPAASPRLRPGPGPAHGQDPRVRGHRRHARLRGRLRLRHPAARTPSSSSPSTPTAASPRTRRPPTPSTRSPIPTTCPGPGGELDLTALLVHRAPGRPGRGPRQPPRRAPERYWVKLEGVRRVGFRTIAVAGTRDPIMIREHRRHPGRRRVPGPRHPQGREASRAASSSTSTARTASWAPWSRSRRSAATSWASSSRPSAPTAGGGRRGLQPDPLDAAPLRLSRPHLHGRQPGLALSRPPMPKWARSSSSRSTT